MRCKLNHKSFRRVYKHPRQSSAALTSYPFYNKQGSVLDSTWDMKPCVSPDSSASCLHYYFLKSKSELKKGEEGISPSPLAYTLQKLLQGFYLYLTVPYGQKPSMESKSSRKQMFWQGLSLQVGTQESSTFKHVRDG